jgi:hypothetical protein
MGNIKCLVLANVKHFKCLVPVGNIKCLVLANVKQGTRGQHQMFGTR